MKSVRFILAGMLAFLVACGTEQTKPSAEETARADIMALDALREQFMGLFKVGDASGLAGLYTEDAILMPPEKPAAAGRQAIEAVFRTTFDRFSAKLNIAFDEIEIAGDWAFERGSYALTLTPKAGGEPIQETGKYLMILRTDSDGSWKLARDIWNADWPRPS